MYLKDWCIFFNKNYTDKCTIFKPYKNRCINRFTKSNPSKCMNNASRTHWSTTVGTTWWDPPRVFGLNNQNSSSQNQGCQWEYPWNGQDQSILLALTIMEPLSRPRTPSFILGFSRRESFRSPTAKGEGERVGVVQGVRASYFLFDIKGCDFTLGLDPFSIHPLLNLH